MQDGADPSPATCRSMPSMSTPALAATRSGALPARTTPADLSGALCPGEPEAALRRSLACYKGVKTFLFAQAHFNLLRLFKS
jgi:hypothetical protein